MHLKNLRALGSCRLALFAVVLLASYADAWAKETSVKRPPPPTPAWPIKDNFFCSAILGSSLYTDDANDRGVKGTLSDGTDHIGMKVEGDRLYFLTQASFEAGDVGGENPFSILVNDDEHVVAIDHDLIRDVSISTFALNRKTGVQCGRKVVRKASSTL